VKFEQCGPFQLPLWPKRELARKIYTNSWLQMFVAGLILGNFLVNIIEKEIDPFPAELQHYTTTWESFDAFFNLAFFVELLLNMWGFGGPYKHFWNSGWNVFDFIVVFVGMLLMSTDALDNTPLSQLKMLRTFRVFRLFKRVKSLKKIVDALINAIPGVVNAFVIMVIFMMFYAILAVEYFAPLGQGCEGRDGNTTECFGQHPYMTAITYNADGTNQSVSVETARGYAFGYEYYGSFTRALFTLFQVMTGESWAEAIARPLMFGLYQDALFVSVFFVSFILLTQIVLTNVIVAVLLDKFVENPDDAGIKQTGRAVDLPEIDVGDFLHSIGIDEDRSIMAFLGCRSQPTVEPEPATVKKDANGGLPGMGLSQSLPESVSPSPPDKIETLLKEMREMREKMNAWEEALVELQSSRSASSLKSVPSERLNSNEGRNIPARV